MVGFFGLELGNVAWGRVRARFRVRVRVTPWLNSKTHQQRIP